MPEKEKRVFFVCKSRNCQEAKKYKTRCTISTMGTAVSELNCDSLNRRQFCVQYSNPMLIQMSNTPNWQVSPDKPGDRNKMQKAKVEEARFYVDNPDFLEVM